MQDRKPNHPPMRNKCKYTNHRAVAIVVTHNRKKLLIKCINALLQQSECCDTIVVDNASTDGTFKLLQDCGLISNERIHYLHLSENVGGSGGFYHGIAYAMSNHWQWFWLMDDDARPEPKAFEHLMSCSIDHRTVYGSVAVEHEKGSLKLCWPVLAINNGVKKIVDCPEKIHNLQQVDNIPFLGFFIHRDLVESIGYPDRGFFIYGDDVEYSERAKKYGAKMVLIKSSKIRHPLSDSKIFNLKYISVAYRQLSPWKTYYDVRNKLFVSKKYFGSKLWTHTLPGIILRAVMSIFIEKKPGIVLYMYAKAILDGLCCRKGKRVLPTEQ